LYRFTLAVGPAMGHPGRGYSRLGARHSIVQRREWSPWNPVFRNVPVSTTAADDGTRHCGEEHHENLETDGAHGPNILFLARCDKGIVSPTDAEGRCWAVEVGRCIAL